jgi:hypothetical protein
MSIAHRRRDRRAALVAASVTALLAGGLLSPGAATAAPAQQDVTWDAVSAPVPTADLLSVAFAEGGVAADTSARAHVLSPLPSPGVTSDDADRGWIASFEGAQAWAAPWSAADYALTNDGVTLEVVFKSPRITSGSPNVFSNLESAGIGLELTAGSDAEHGRIDVWAHTGGTYGTRAYAEFSYDEWVHAIAVFDGARKKLYLNGDLVSDVAANGATLTTPASAAQKFVIGGDTNGSGNLQFPFRGSISAARVYSAPVSAFDAYRLSVASGLAEDVIKPLVRAKSTPDGSAQAGSAYSAPEAEAVDDSSGIASTALSVTDPDGTTIPLDLDARSFTPESDGVYTLIYSAIDGAGNVGTAEYRIAVGDADLPEEPADPEVPEESGSTADGVVDWKFSAIGDIHNNWDELREAYAFWASQGVTDTLWPGDLTNNATAAEFTALKGVLDEMAGYGIDHYVSPGNHDVNSNLNTYSLFEAATGQRPNADYVVNGYHVISVSPGAGVFTEDADPVGENAVASAGVSTGNSGAYAYAANWLNARLAEITAAEPEKPVFILVHHPIRCTHYVSNEWYGSGLATGCGDAFESFLEDYPQAVVWGGHIHTPNHIPTSIWQGTAAGGGFTTVNAPPLAYYEMESGVIGANSRSNDSTPDDAGNNRETAIVEVDGSHVRITNYDLLADMWEPTVWEWDVATSIDTSLSYEERFPLGDARKDQTSAPVWQEDDAITLTAITENDAYATWSQAEAAPNDVHDIVQTYQVEVVNLATGQTVNTFKRWSRYYVMPLPETVGHEVWNLQPGTDYEIRISPINAWGKVGDALTTTFRSAGAGVDPDMPTVRAATTPAATGTTGASYDVPALQVVGDASTITNTSITVLGPWGDESASLDADGGSFTPAQPGAYTLVYAARDAEGKGNEQRYPVTISGDTAEPSETLPAADMIDVDFWNADRSGIAESAALTDHSPNDRIFQRVTGAPIAMDAELGKPVATFTQRPAVAEPWKTAFSLADYELFNDGYAIETSFKISPFTGTYLNVFSNQQSAGVGFDIESRGTEAELIMYTSPAPSSGSRPSVRLQFDTWYQVVGINNGAHMRLYVNGELVATAPTGGTPVNTPGANSRWWVIGGDTGGSNDVTNPFLGVISTARIWSNPLSSGDVAALYAASEISGPAAPETGTLQGVVSDDDGPLESITVYLFEDGQTEQAIAATETNADGFYWFPGRAAGDYDLAFGDGGRLWNTLWRTSNPTVPAGGSVAVDVQLTPLPATGTMQGVVSGPAGPVAGVTVYLYPHGDGSAALYATTTNADGFYWFPGIPAGSYDVAFSDCGHAWITEWFDEGSGALEQSGATAVELAPRGWSNASASLVPLS